MSPEDIAIVERVLEDSRTHKVDLVAGMYLNFSRSCGCALGVTRVAADRIDAEGTLESRDVFSEYHNTSYMFAYGVDDGFETPFREEKMRNYATERDYVRGRAVGELIWARRAEGYVDARDRGDAQ